jgi:hypothetical protein
MVTTKEVLQASPIGEELVEYGRHEGQLSEAHRGLAVLVEIRFPGLIAGSAIGNLTDLDTIRGLFRALASASDLDHARSTVARIQNA